MKKDLTKFTEFLDMKRFLLTLVLLCLVCPTSTLIGNPMQPHVPVADIVPARVPSKW